jgi:hypothetical protein
VYRDPWLRASSILAVAILLAAPVAEARNPIRNTFLNIYPNATNTQLDDLPSRANHCGVCHFDFAGGGTRNPYGLGVEIGLNSGLNNSQAILAIENTDSDGDGYTNLVEITSTLFANTPTFPGLTQLNKNSVSNIPVSEVEPYLTPSGGSDTTPPAVAVLSPNGGENLSAGGFSSVSYTATDGSGISHVNFYLSEDQGATWRPVGRNESSTGTFAWFVPNRPGGTNRIRVEAFDNAGNPGSDASDGDFAIAGVPAGFVPSTLRDMDLSGTQPFEGAVLDDPSGCGSCHGGYDPEVEPWHGWSGSMMGQAARDPLFLACLAIAEQDAPSVGDLCIRCHSPGGWQEGRSTDTGGGLLTAKDRHGVQCDFCHRAVDHNYVPGTSPALDTLVLQTIVPLPLGYANGQFINDPAPYRRGPYADALASHQFLESPFHRSSDICGICHDVSNPVFVKTGPGKYAPNGFDEEHPDMDLRNMFPIERTYSEWSRSEYAATGVYAPQFAGNKPDGIVSTCQDCHMRDVVGAGCNEPGSPTRTDLPLHDFMGGNAFLPDILPGFWPGETDSLVLQDGKQRAIDMLRLAATLEATPTEYGVLVRVTNETAHKLPSGYPEGRRIWLNVRAVDGSGQTVFESGHYDFGTGELSHDEQAKIYEIHPGLSPGLASALGLPAGSSFHFVLNDTIYEDNRIPPRGFTNAEFEAIQSPPVAYSYADGAYWDDTPYNLPASAETVHVTLYYQTTTKEYVEFLRDENTTNSAGDDLYAAWAAHGKGAPVAMAEISTPVEILTDVAEAEVAPRPALALHAGAPNPFRSSTTISYAVPERGKVSVRVYDIRGRSVRTLVDEVQAARFHTAIWDGRDDGGRAVDSGVYFIRLQAGDKTITKRSLLLR